MLLSKTVLHVIESPIRSLRSNESRGGGREVMVNDTKIIMNALPISFTVLKMFTCAFLQFLM